jgi:hypothetical protein
MGVKDRCANQFQIKLKEIPDLEFEESLRNLTTFVKDMNIFPSTIQSADNLIMESPIQEKQKISKRDTIKINEEEESIQQDIVDKLEDEKSCSVEYFPSQSEITKDLSQSTDDMTIDTGNTFFIFA